MSVVEKNSITEKKPIAEKKPVVEKELMTEKYFNTYILPKLIKEFKHQVSEDGNLRLLNTIQNRIIIFSPERGDDYDGTFSLRILVTPILRDSFRNIQEEFQKLIDNALGKCKFEKNIKFTGIEVIPGSTKNVEESYGYLDKTKQDIHKTKNTIRIFLSICVIFFITIVTIIFFLVDVKPLIAIIIICAIFFVLFTILLSIYKTKQFALESKFQEMQWNEKEESRMESIIKDKYWLTDIKYFLQGHLNKNWLSMGKFNDQAQNNANKAFSYAVKFSVAGLCIMILAMLIPIVRPNESENLAAVIGAISGGIIQLLSAGIFWVYKNQIAQMDKYHQIIADIQRYLSLANLATITNESDVLLREIITAYLPNHNFGTSTENKEDINQTNNKDDNESEKNEHGNKEL